MSTNTESPFDPNNAVVQLCAQGMEMEGKGEDEAAATLFMRAWNEATTDFDKFTAAHFVARHQKSVRDKLTWDEIALAMALSVNNDTVKGSFPSLYLNIAKCYEELNEVDTAKKNYELARSYMHLLPDDGYGTMIKGGISRGIERINGGKTQGQ